MAESSGVRARFKRYLGEEQYAKFVGDLPMPNKRSRLRFWQEQAWERFVVDNSDCVLSTIEILEVFADCPEHGARLRREEHLRRIASWLTREISPESLKQKFGGSERFENLENQFKPGDAYYEFRSPPQTWQRMAGRAGIALVRNDKVVDSFVTLMN